MRFGVDKLGAPRRARADGHNAPVRAWMNGRAAAATPTAPAVTVTDHGLTVGDGVFEAVKVVDGRPFALRPAPRAAGPLRGGARARRRRTRTRTAGDRRRCSRPSTWPLGRLRITYTAGPAPLGSGRGDAAPTLIVVAAPMAAAADDAAVATVPWPRNERGALAGLKTTSYAENVVALAHAKERGAGEAVFANLAGHLCEGTGTNVFYVVDGELRTPTLASGCLAGVTRALVLEWYGGREVDEPIEIVRAGQRGLPRLDDARRPGRSRTGTTASSSAPGPVTLAAQEAWRRMRGQLVLGDGLESATATRQHRGDWRSGSALRSHRRGHWFEPSIAHLAMPNDPFGRVADHGGSPARVGTSMPSSCPSTTRSWRSTSPPRSARPRRTA